MSDEPRRQPERRKLEGRRASDPPDLEARVRQLELWAVATHGQIGRMHARSEALEPVVNKLADAAEQGAAVAQALEDANARRNSRVTMYVGWGAGVVGIAAAVWGKGLLG